MRRWLAATNEVDPGVPLRDDLAGDVHRCRPLGWWSGSALTCATEDWRRCCSARRSEMLWQVQQMHWLRQVHQSRQPALPMQS